MIKYKATVGAITTELECQTIGELIEYLNHDKEGQEESRVVLKTDRFVVKSNEPLVWNDGEYWPKTQPFFIRPDNTLHQPKTETIKGELWYVNDGQQPVGDEVRVDVLTYGKKIETLLSNEVSFDLDESFKPLMVTHWRLAK